MRTISSRRGASPMPISIVTIRSGTTSLGPTVNDVSNGGTEDLVVMDDFIYGEPVPLPEPSSLALLGLVSCLRPARWRLTSPLWLSLIIYMGIIFAVGDTVARYLLPVDWIGMVLVALGLDWVLGFLWRDKKPAEPDAPNLEEPAAA